MRLTSFPNLRLSDTLISVGEANNGWLLAFGIDWMGVFDFGL
jgi:hypothetical protein